MGSPVERDVANSRLRDSINTELDRAEKIWSQVGAELMKSNVLSFSDSALNASSIPGYPKIDPGKPAVDEFIAMVVDMRDSTKHLLVDISKDKADVTLTQRLFYETSALLNAVAEAIHHQGGSVTEYLGDGVLALFRAKDAREETCRVVCRTARWIMGDVRSILNGVLNQRYRLPPLDLGVGLAYSKAVVTVVGRHGDRTPKAIGECIYRASKLSSVRNEIAVDSRLEAIWPISKTGGFAFGRKRVHDMDAHIIPLGQ